MSSYAKNMVTVYLLDENSREVLTVQNIGIYQQFRDIKQIIGEPNAKFSYQTHWCDSFDGDHFVRTKGDVERKIV